MKNKFCARFKNKMCVNKINPQPLDNFYESKGMKDGRAAKCKECIKAINHQKRLDIGGGKLRVAKRPPSIPLKEKNCSSFKSGKCVSPINPQPIENFGAQLGRVNGRSQCIACQKEYTKKNSGKSRIRSKLWNIENKERRRNFLYNKLYGINLDEYNKMFEKQNGCCSICKIHQSKLSQTISVDHCHVSGKIRELLCHKCNRGIGLFNDSIEIVEKVLAYLKRHKEE